MARPPHTLKKDKLIEGVGGLRIMHDVGAKVHKLKDLQAARARCCSPTASARSSARSTSRPAASTRGASSRSRPTTSTSVKRLAEIAQHDWEHSHPLDLTDEGLIADLEKRGRRGRRDKLVLKEKAKATSAAEAKAKGKEKPKAKAMSKAKSKAKANSKAGKKARKKV